MGLADRPKRSFTAIALESSLSGFIEAIALVLLVKAALSISADGKPIDISAAGFDISLTASSALVYSAILMTSCALLHISNARSVADLSANVLDNSRARALSAYTAANWERQSMEREGGLQELTSTLAQQASIVTAYAATALGSALSVTALTVVAVLISPGFAVVVGLMACVLALIIKPLGRSTSRRGTAVVTANSLFAEEVAATASISLELRAFGVEGTKLSRLLGLNQQTTHLVRSARFTGRIAAYVFKDIAILFIIIVLLVLIGWSNVDLASVGSVIFLSVRGLAYAQMANNNVQRYNEEAPHLVHLIARIEDLERAAEPQRSAYPTRFLRIEFNAVSFAYGGRLLALDNLSLTIESGDAVGIVGKSGSGKSTMLQLLLGLREPTSGEISLDGVPLANVSRPEWARLVGFVPQQPRLIEGTIAENLAFYRPGFSTAEMEEATRRAHVFEEIMMLPDGFATKLGPRGSGLSGGQAQRLAIARALLGRPQLLILDEPTSALDPTSESALHRTLSDLVGEITMVIVAHRESTLDLCTSVLALDQGAVVAYGTAVEVLAEHLPGRSELVDVLGIHNGHTVDVASTAPVDAQNKIPLATNVVGMPTQDKQT